MSDNSLGLQIVEEKHVTPIADLQKMADVMAPLFGKKPQDMLALMLLSQAEGKHPAIAAQEYDIINGKPAINSRAAQSRFQMAGGSIRWIKRTDKEASVEFSHPQSGALTITWTMERAAQAGLTGKDVWKKFPAQMLAARCIAEGVRACFPACLSGLYTVEEVQYFPFSPPQAAEPQDKALRDSVIQYIASVKDQIPDPQLKKIRAELTEAKNDFEKLNKVKLTVESIINAEPVIKKAEMVSDIDSMASEAFDAATN